MTLTEFFKSIQKAPKRTYFSMAKVLREIILSYVHMKFIQRNKK